MPMTRRDRPVAVAAVLPFRLHCGCCRSPTVATMAAAFAILPDGTMYSGFAPATGWCRLMPAMSGSSMGVIGPMARTVADLAMLLSIQAGYDTRLPLSMDGDGTRFQE